jgi:biotin synthase
MSADRARELREAGVQRVHHNVETASSYYDEVTTTVRYEGRLRTIAAVREAGLETCVGGILNLGETRAQRVEMAFELAAINPTSVPINLLNPRPGTKFGDRELIDPWEAVKWIAIFRLILPEALFRLCGGRAENLGPLQPLAVKAGLNGVMMGNFLTTLGAAPEEDREMFEAHGLNIARQPDNASNPRPDNRSGWMSGETPDVLEDYLEPAADGSEVVTREAAAGASARSDSEDGLKIRLWDPSQQLRYRAKRSVPPRPDGAPNRSPRRLAAR